MHFTSLSAVVIFVMILTVFKYAVSGYKKGLSKALIGLGATLFAVFFGAVVSIWLVGLFGDGVLEWVKEYAFYYDLCDLIMGYEEVLDLVVKMVFTLIAYLPVFYILRSLFLLVVFIFMKKKSHDKSRAGKGYYKECEDYYVKKNKTIAAAVGMLGGFIISVVCLSPLSGGMRAASAILDFAENLSGSEELSEDEVVSSIHYFADDYCLASVGGMGGNMLFNFATTVGNGDERTNLYRELDALANIDIELLEKVISDIGNGKKSTRSLNKVIEMIESSRIIEMIFAEMISSAADSWLEDEDYLGMEKPRFGDHRAIDSFVNELLYVCKSTNTETVSADITTLVNVSNLFAVHDDIYSGDYESIAGILWNDGLVDDIRAELSKNPHMNTALMAVDDIVMTVIAEEIVDIDYSEIDREVLYSEIASILTSTADKSGTQRVTAVTAIVQESLYDYGIQVPDDINEDIARKLVEEIEVYDGMVTIDNVREFFDGYAFPDEIDPDIFLPVVPEQ